MNADSYRGQACNLNVRIISLEHSHDVYACTTWSDKQTNTVLNKTLYEGHICPLVISLRPLELSAVLLWGGIAIAFFRSSSLWSRSSPLGLNAQPWFTWVSSVQWSGTGSGLRGFESHFHHLLGSWGNHLTFLWFSFLHVWNNSIYHTAIVRSKWIWIFKAF